MSKQNQTLLDLKSVQRTIVFIEKQLREEAEMSKPLLKRMKIHLEKCRLAETLLVEKLEKTGGTFTDDRTCDSVLLP